MVTCKVCGNMYKRITKSHLMKHGIKNESEYIKLYPDAILMDDIHKLNISIGTKRGMDNDIVREKLRYTRTKDSREKLSKAATENHAKGKYTHCYSNIERNKKISEGRIRYWQRTDKSILKVWLKDYIGSETHINQCKSNQKKATKASLRVKISKPEKEYAKKLKEDGIEFIQQYYVGRYPFDFYIPSKNLLIEIDGEFYHPLTELDCIYDIQKHNFKRDIMKTKTAIDNGYKLERIRV